MVASTGTELPGHWHYRVQLGNEEKKAVAAQLGVKAGVLVHPARFAATGSNAGPSLYHLLEVLGRKRVLERFDRALSKMSS